MIHETFDAVAAEYVSGALALLDTDPDLCRRFHDTEAAIDAAVKAEPTERELRAALTVHVSVIRECCARYQAQRERQGELTAPVRADPMPELPDGATMAVGFSYGDGTPGAWGRIR
jgi:hypothetical protein